MKGNKSSMVRDGVHSYHVMVSLTRTKECKIVFGTLRGLGKLYVKKLEALQRVHKSPRENEVVLSIDHYQRTIKGYCPRKILSCKSYYGKMICPF
ncbi:hypothetical protein TNIN_461 [Trichonephila inaurata madagascariensis]|uniref:Uncharacterized protein n=1 Tax=Trichonephila inaurata madagascariensis TaxID=2747483 RepID=A0A8X6KPR0_9ARAC|nr:hypothetical protein TNIN_461 [Trichonephila inaurata madagascariensis]